MARVYEELMDFIASGSTPDEVVAWLPSAKARGRVAELIQREKAGALSDEDQGELRHYLVVEHLMRRVKARVRQRRGGGR